MGDRLKKGVLLLSFGSPDSVQEIEEYYFRIKKGKEFSRKEIEDLKEKYKRIGGRSPLKEIILRQAEKLRKMLGEDYDVFLGMKYSKPFIEETVFEMREKGIKRGIAIVLSPFYSEFSISDYFKRVDEVKGDIEFIYIKGFYQNLSFINLICDRIKEKVKEFEKEEGIFYIFTAHSLPKIFLSKNDPYQKSIKLCACEISKKLGLKNFEIAYQSAPKDQKEWLSPSLKDVILKAKRMGFINVLIIPFGFVNDHLEVLYEVDIELKEFADNEGINLKRIELLNDDERFINLLYELVKINL